jgi:hypothetical protein
MFQHAGAPVRVSTNLVTTLLAKVCVFRAFRQETNAKNILSALILFLDFDSKPFKLILSSFIVCACIIYDLDLLVIEKL